MNCCREDRAVEAVAEDDGAPTAAAAVDAVDAGRVDCRDPFCLAFVLVFDWATADCSTPPTFGRSCCWCWCCCNCCFSSNCSLSQDVNSRVESSASGRNNDTSTPLASPPSALKPSISCVASSHANPVGSTADATPESSPFNAGAGCGDIACHCCSAARAPATAFAAELIAADTPAC
jgi:hypothetical protein